MSSGRTASEMATRYRSGIVVHLRLDRRARLVRTLTGAPSIAAPLHVDLVNQCAAFKPLREHARDRLREWRQQSTGSGRHLWPLLNVLTGVPATERGMVRLLSQLAARGLLIDEADARPPLPPDAEAARIDTIGILTRNRPQQILPCVEAYARHLAASGRSCSWIVMDDSDPPYHDDMTRVVGAAARRVGRPILHINRRVKRRFADRLARRGIPPAVAAFALLGFEGVESRSGANANGLALAGAGRPVFWIQDPTARNLARRPWVAPGLRFESTADPRRPEFFSERSELLAATTEADADFLTDHEELLGATPGACAARFGPSIDWAADLDAARFERLVTGRGRVRVSVNGVAGAGAWQWAAHLCDCPDHRSEVAATTVRSAFGAGAAGVYSHTVDAVTISGGACCLAPCLAMDHRALLAPFLPVGHSPESVFIRASRCCDGDLLTAFLPGLSVTEPRYCRAEGPTSAGSSSIQGVSRILAAILDSYQADPTWWPPADGMRRLGRHLGELAALDREEYERCIRRIVLDRLSHGFTLDASSGDPDTRLLIDWAGGGPSLRLSDIVDGLQGDDSMSACQRVVEMYGQLLEHWPDLVTEARALQSELEDLAAERSNGRSRVTQSLTTGSPP